MGASMFRPVATLASLALVACAVPVTPAATPADLNVGACMPLDQIDDHDLKL